MTENKDFSAHGRLSGLENTSSLPILGLSVVDSVGENVLHALSTTLALELILYTPSLYIRQNIIV